MTSFNPNAKRIAVVDNYNQGSQVAVVNGKETLVPVGIDLDGDGVGDISHGEAVELFLKKANPNIQIERYDIGSNEEGKYNEADPYKTLAMLEAISQKGNYYDGVNLSQSGEIKYDDGGLTPDNLKDYRNEIRNSGPNDIWKQNIYALEKITGQGVPVFTSSGNNNNKWDLYSAANGVQSVGAGYLGGTNPANYTANSLVDSYFDGLFAPRAIKDADGKVVGVDVDNDGKIDLSGDQLSNKGNTFGNPALFGKAFSSFSTPNALGNFTRNSGKVVTPEEMKLTPADRTLSKNGSPILSEFLKVSTISTPADLVIKKSSNEPPPNYQIRNNDLDGKAGDSLDSTVHPDKDITEDDFDTIEKNSAFEKAKAMSKSSSSSSKKSESKSKATEAKEKVSKKLDSLSLDDDDDF